jgi:hypothetical protein
MLSNGRELYALRCFRQYKSHFTLYYYQTASGVAICSEPIDYSVFDQTGWAPIANNTLLKVHGTPPQIEVVSLAKTL